MVRCSLGEVSVVRVGWNLSHVCRVLLATCSVACLHGGCSLLSKDECDHGEYRCLRDRVQICIDDPSIGAQWYTRDVCQDGTVCVEGPYICAFGGVPDPRCLVPGACSDPACYRNQTCDGTWILWCFHGYLTGQYQCPSGTCAVPDGGTEAVCAAPADPVCTLATTDNYFRCDGAVLVQCNGANRVAQRDCATSCFSCTDPPKVGQCVQTAQGIDCVPLGPPNPACANTSVGDFVCVGNTAYKCTLGYALSRQVCRSCVVDAGASSGCRGALFYPCTTTSDCADGLVCQADAFGIQSCRGACVTDTDCALLAEGVTDGLVQPSKWRCINGWCG